MSIASKALKFIKFGKILYSSETILGIIFYFRWALKTLDL
jgi:hypothetical protein